MTQKERMEAGSLYDPADEAIVKEQKGRAHFLKEYNALGQGDEAKMQALLQKMFAECGEGVYLQPPFYANWAGRNVHVGDNVYANFNLTLVDDTDIYVGDSVMFAPNVVVATAGHPINPELRRRVAQYNLPVHIGNNVWIGAGAVILPGVTIGDNSVIGAGSVVTRDIPANVVAVGNPCRVIREIGEHDREYYYRDLKIDPDIFNA